jgi:hypothetical protein
LATTAATPVVVVVAAELLLLTQALQRFLRLQEVVVDLAAVVVGLGLILL